MVWRYGEYVRVTKNLALIHSVVSKKTMSTDDRHGCMTTDDGRPHDDSSSAVQ